MVLHVLVRDSDSVNGNLHQVSYGSSYKSACSADVALIDVPYIILSMWLLIFQLSFSNVIILII